MFARSGCAKEKRSFPTRSSATWLRAPPEDVAQMMRDFAAL
jgi:hypothetical protein